LGLCFLALVSYRGWAPEPAKVIETTVPEINITELMERVRAEALRPKPPPRRSTSPAETATALPTVSKLPSAPAVWIPGPVKGRKERLDQLVETAREKNEPHSRIPKFLRRFFRKQGAHNRAVLESIATLSKTSDDLTRRVGEITTCLGQLNGWLLAIHEQSDGDANWMAAAAPRVSRIAGHEDELRQLQSELVSAQATLNILSADRAKREETDRRVAAFADQVRDQIDAIRQHADDLRGRVDLFGRELERIGAESEAFRTESRASLRSDLGKAGEHLRNLQAQTDRLGEHVTNLQGHVDRQTGEAMTLRDSFDQRVDEIANDAAFLKGELSEYGLLLRELLSNESKQGVAPRNAAKTRGPVGLDSFYFNFENRFRGSRNEIKTRVAFYLPFIQKARAGSARRPILDLGCGRGEWLELLKENKLEGRGIDLNTTMIAHCKAHGLKVKLADAVEYMRSLRANSHGAITGFHVIEHVPFETLMDLFGETRRVLQPGGVAIFESPNCKNLMVGACNFNIDPTHRNPVFPETAEFMLASHGFEKIRIEYLSPASGIKFDGATPELATIKDLLFGPQDFGIIAYKPKAR
jgi:SAM-dependent methyltransferase